MIKSKILIFIVFILLFIFVILVGGTMPYFLLYIFSLTFIIPFLHGLITQRRLRGSVEIPKDALFTGDSININYQVENTSSLSIPYLEIQSDITKKLTGTANFNVIVSLGKKETFTRGETVILKRRGYYQLGEIDVTIRDVFRIFSFKKKFSSSTSLLVYPETINLSTFKITSSQQSGELLIHNLAFQDKSRVSSLRDYREGDSVKAIHWKLSAKKDSPIIKDYENRVDTNAVIFLDNNKLLFKYDVDRHLEDTLADIALSIVNYFLNQSIEVILETQNEGKYIQVYGQQKSDLKPFLETLALFTGNGTYDAKSLLLARLERIKKGSTFIIITPNLDKSMGAVGIQLKMKNLNPLFIVVTDMENRTGNIDLTVEKRLNQDMIPVYIIDHSTSIKESLEVHDG